MELRRGERWCVLGDFNFIKELFERKGVDGYSRSEEIQLFGDLISKAGLIDFPWVIGSTCRIKQMVQL